MRKYSFKELKRFSQIAEILDIEIDDSADLYRGLKKNTAEENHAAMLIEIADEDDQNVNFLKQTCEGF